MKLDISLRYLSFFSLLLMVLHFSSCKTKIEILDECEDYIFKNLDDNKSYFVKLDTIDEIHAEGRIYYIHKGLTIKSESFTMKLCRNKCLVEFSNSNIYTLKLKKRRGFDYEGIFVSNVFKGKRRFVFYPYQDSDYISYEHDRYKDNLFDVERIADVEYANVDGFWSSLPDDTININAIVKTGVLKSLKKNELKLTMDIYIPKNDTLSRRPLIMLIHGGAYFIGDKASLPYQKWCTHFASLGYVCASINYRMGFRINAKSIERTAYQAIQDAHAAMRYLVSKKDLYRIDTDFLFVGGSSAGSITAMNLAYMRNENRPASSYSTLFLDDLGNLETSGNRIHNRFRIKAVANMWGVVHDLNILNNSHASIISFHGDEDGILPYKQGFPFETIGELRKIMFNEMYGSYCIHEKAQELGIRSELHTFNGQGHALHLDKNREINDNFYTIQNEIVDFFYDELVVNPAYIVQDKSDVQLFTIDTTDVVTSKWSVVGGVAIDKSKGKIRASWFDDELGHELRVSGVYTNGAVFEDVFLMKKNEKNEDSSY